MNAWMITFGCIALAISIGLLILGRNQARKLPWKTSGVFFLAGVFFFSANGLLFYSEPGYSYLVQYPTGTQIAELQPGLHFKFWGQAVPFKKVVTVKFRSAEEQAQDENVYSGMRNAIPVRFNDAVKANISLSARFRMPESEVVFLKMASEFRTQDNLVNSSLIPACMEVAKNSARLISAQEYIAGRGGELESAVLDQLENGMYILVAREMKETGTDTIAAVNKMRTIENRTMVRYEVSKKRSADGKIMRKKHPVSDYNIIVAQATVEDVNPETRFKEMLGKQRDAAAQASIEKEKAKQAEYEKQRIIAQGEAQKAKIKVDMEKEQIMTLITIETEMKREQITVDKRKLELESARLKAQETKVLADAEAYQKRKVMEADGALELKLKTYEKVHAAYAEAIKGTSLVPATYISGSGGSGKGTPNSLDFINIATANMAQDLNLKMKTPGKN
ncbi:SPFH domain-containing protein [Roseivirga sp. BDSF3-8]|uniref:SPFH domain-containing protein n=1 Tax=Roseivirga sp. BDSF3-8 TaxID=3241598 RepID=UPI0035323A79